MEKQWYEQFRDAADSESQEQFAQLIYRGGYSLFSKFIDGFREAIRIYDEPESETMQELVERASAMFPTPIQFSPHWQSVWEDFKLIVQHKNSIFQRVPYSERAGEWQIILDNPFTNQDVVCYPALPFIEAAYLFGYFRPELKENEYLRLQKIENRIVEFGFTEPIAVN